MKIKTEHILIAGAGIMLFGGGAGIGAGIKDWLAKLGKPKPIEEEGGKLQTSIGGFLNLGGTAGIVPYVPTLQQVAASLGLESVINPSPFAVVDTLINLAPGSFDVVPTHSIPQQALFATPSGRTIAATCNPAAEGKSFYIQALGGPVVCKGGYLVRGL